jgi:hypothetical protein
MPDPDRFTPAELRRLAGSAVAKVDLLGPRGTTLCTMEEVEALAVVAALSGLLAERPASDVHHPMHFPTKERT